MIIQHNIPAMNAYRNYSNNAKLLNSNLEKLSSGYKINRAGDDAAGLAISEKMRAQITGLEVATKNAKDGISVVQTAEGALTEVHDMLNRMYNLAEQSANGTYKQSERDKLQQEINQLNTEIDRIADSTNFNGLKLLDGSLSTRDAGTTRVSLTGRSRIINTVIADGEKPYEVAGKKTITDRYIANGTAAKASFKIDLSEVTFKVNSTNLNSNTSVASVSAGDVTLNIGGTTIKTNGDMKVSVQSGGTLDDVKATAVVTSFIANITANNSTGSAKVTINGVEWEVQATAGVGGAGTALLFTQTSTPKTEKEAQTNFDVRVGIESADETGSVASDNTFATMTINPLGAHKVGTDTVQLGVAEGSGNRTANTIIKMTEADIVDGAVIRLGNGSQAKSFILKVGADSTTKQGTNTGLVDLTGMEEGSINLNKALDAISAKINENSNGNSSFTFQYNAVDSNGTNQGVKVANFNVGVSDGSNGFPVGLAITRVDTLDDQNQFAYFTSLDKFDGVFSMKYDKTVTAQDGLKLQIGDTADSWNQLKVSIADMHAEALGLGGLDITSADSAAGAMEKIMNAIDLVSETRANLGAIQNRLDHTINNLSVTRENLQDAESTIRDTDVAEEMMSYTKNSILNQAAQAMLAQANQLPQGVLQLLG